MIPDIALLRTVEKLLRQQSDAVLNPLFGDTRAEIKTDGSIVTQADRTMQNRLAEALRQIAPNVVLLGEEMTTQKQQAVLQSDQAYWCLDPVDGTNNFHHGVPLYSVSLALVIKRQVQLGLVYDPVRQECFSALRGHGLLINGEQPPNREIPDALNGTLACVDFKRLGETRRQKLAAHMPFKSQRNIGSCALEWAWVAAGRIHLLLHGGEKIWDYAAGCLLVEEAGGISSDFDGRPIFNHSLQPRPVVAAVNPGLYRDWFDQVSSGPENAS
jgi:myo-inositol-1(or 4)-monophosphatase